MSFDPEEFWRRLDAAEQAAKRAADPLVIRAKPMAQAGTTILIGKCPCGEVAALSGEGRHLCRRCNRWLRYVREG